MRAASTLLSRKAGENLATQVHYRSYDLVGKGDLRVI